MANKFIEAEDVKEMASQLIKRYHKDLVEARFNFCYKEGTWNKQGNICAGDVKVISPYMQMLSDVDFGVIINFAYWNQLNNEKKLALLDHLLTHCGRIDDKEGNPKWIKINHSIEEFPSVARRHGTYTSELELMKTALDEYSQKSIDENDENNEKED